MKRRGEIFSREEFLFQQGFHLPIIPTIIRYPIAVARACAAITSCYSARCDTRVTYGAILTRE